MQTNIYYVVRETFYSGAGDTEDHIDHIFYDSEKARSYLENSEKAWTYINDMSVMDGHLFRLYTKKLAREETAVCSAPPESLVNKLKEMK